MLQEIVQFLDHFLDLNAVEDYPNALNGLQLENSGKVTRIAAAVDAAEAVIGRAIDQGADLLLVHHGLFWGGLTRISGASYRKLQKALSGDLAIYSAHLPLDLHPEVGNNVLLAKALHLPISEPFFFEKGKALGVRANVKLDRNELILRLESLLGQRPWICPAGPQQIQKVGLVTGGAGGQIAKAAAEGVDTFISGEGPHHVFGLAEELRINLVLAGHYATETFGVRTLAESLAKEYHLPFVFIDYPSGL